jgi:methylthioribulose-1-phosphate dehydratase
MSNDLIRVQQRELQQIIHWFHAKGWAPATSTNYSFRNPAPGADTYTISRSGVDKGGFQLTDFMQVDAQGQALPGFQHLKPSAETGLHTMLYGLFPGVHAILHTHSVLNTVLSLGCTSLTLEGYELLKGLDGIHTHNTSVEVPVFANSQDIAALSREVGTYLVDHPHTKGFLLAGHGLYTWGKTLADAKRHVEVFEFLFECEHLRKRC